ncbi:MazG-like pyrophosphatase [Serratia phage phiMAM1]|uniref:Uncharacterized protein n=1 Tax=Serratia phage phiMAM1 TaxID=1262513 RepID=K7YH40_9CAUD|nr:MazG-like pyrophosphatase [Serratia phage phiMAM1]AFX93659.1 hypothetical protein MAM_191 [Serratia phage phiMAM1]
MKSDLFDIIFNTALEAPDRTVAFVWGKVGEELGEINMATLGLSDEPVHAEIADYIIALTDLFYLTTSKIHNQVLFHYPAHLKQFVQFNTGLGSEGDNVSDILTKHGFTKKEIPPQILLRIMAADYGMLCRALNQPDRCESCTEDYIVKCMVSACDLLVSEMKETDFVFKDVVSAKVSKWRRKVGLVN